MNFPFTRENFLYTTLIENLVDDLHDDFKRVYGEINNLKTIITPTQTANIAEWKGSFVYFTKRKQKWDPNAERMSTTLKHLVSIIPETHLSGIWFSALLPGCVIPPHTDNYVSHDPYVRVHLPLIVPEGDLGITIDNQTFQWTRGKVLVFDQNKMHNAWNATNQSRLNLNFNFSERAFNV
jgi:aspartyl/asparaginyl beta-hydroxylase (cupin superfamily)